nr:hypothetical protein KRP22_14889 [Phytophthora ramorum]
MATLSVCQSVIARSLLHLSPRCSAIAAPLYRHAAKLAGSPGRSAICSPDAGHHRSASALVGGHRARGRHCGPEAHVRTRRLLRTTRQRQLRMPTISARHH